MTLVEYILKYLSLLLSGTVAFSFISIKIIKFFIEKSFNYAELKFKSGLDKELANHTQLLNIKTEEFKNNLENKTLEYNIKFSKLHHDRAEVLKIIYCKIVTLHKNLSHLTSRAQGPEWHTDKYRDNLANENIKELNDYITLNKIYLPQNICDLLSNLINECKYVTFQMFITKREANFVLGVAPEFANTTLRKSVYASWFKLTDKVNNDINSLKEEIEEEFRKLLG